MKKISAQRIAAIKAAQKIRWAKIMSKNPGSANAKPLEVLPPVKSAPCADLITGDDTAQAKKLNKLYTDAQNGMRKIIALGLLAWEIKETKLKHGEFGNWLATHCPKLATVDSVTGKAVSSRALRGYMDLTKSVLENVGYPTIGNYMETVAKLANDANLGGGKFLLIADKKVPEDLKSVHDKICELVDGKTQRALFSEFKQSDEDSGKPKVGRLKGQGGSSKEGREAAAQLVEEKRLVELELECNDAIAWAMNNADGKHLGMMDSQLLVKLQTAWQTGSGFITRLLASRKGNGGAQ